MRLTADARAFFKLLSEAAFANPFSEKRERLDARLAGVSADTPWDVAIAKLLGKVAERLVEAQSRLDLRAWDDDDRELLLLALLFEVFHRFAPHLDALIESEAAGAASRRVPFAKDAIRALERHGVAHDEAYRHLALFWQLRRAYFFIERTLPGRTPSMRRLRESLWNNVFSNDVRLYARALWNRMEDFSTFLLGETGVGKGAAAAAIGRSGFIPFDEKSETFRASFTEAFLAINLSSYAEGLVESELFGHRRGAFTGAIDAHRGVFQRCSRYGAIFLDEIGDVTKEVQTKLLRVLQERAFSPVGARETLRFEGRVIAATNRPIADLRREGRFRDDFYYRLSSDVIRVPTLRERLHEDPEEMDVLLAAILPRVAGDDVPQLRARVRDAIARDLGAAYPWPGNVRELEQCARRVILTGRCSPDVPDVRATQPQGLLDATNGGAWTAAELMARYCRALHERHRTYEEVARRTGLDRRTVKRYVDAAR